jgi:hypothetical protein
VRKCTESKKHKCNTIIKHSLLKNINPSPCSTTDGSGSFKNTSMKNKVKLYDKTTCSLSKHLTRSYRLQNTHNVTR